MNALEPRAERFAQGRAARRTCARSTLAEWSPDGRDDPLEIIRREEADRLPELLEVRHERMRAGPFAFFRGGNLRVESEDRRPR